MADLERPRVFLDVSIGTEPIGRLVIELFADKTPKTCENFRSICTGTTKGLTYKLSTFHRVIDEFMIQGGDITKGDGTGGMSIYGGEFEDENIGWRQIDEAGLLCMANRGRDTNSSQFFITLAPCEHLNAKHTVFGRLVAGQDSLQRIAEVSVDKSDRPLTDVVVSHCGELERRVNKKRGAIDAIHQDVEPPASSRQSTTSRGRHKRRHVDSASHSRSRSPSRGHTRRSASRHRHNHRHRRQRTDMKRSNDEMEGGTETTARSSQSRSRTPTDAHASRRRSDAQADHTKRGRRRRRSRSRSPTQRYDDHDGDGNGDLDVRKRSPAPSRQQSQSPGYRRQRSLPNQYHLHRQQARQSRWPESNRHVDEAEEDRLARMEWERDGGHRRSYGDRSSGGGRLGGYGDSSGRLGGSGDLEDTHEDGGIVYKGRGAMKFREKQYR